MSERCHDKEQNALAALPPVDAGAFPPVEAGALEAGLGGMVSVRVLGRVWEEKRKKERKRCGACLKRKGLRLELR